MELLVVVLIIAIGAAIAVPTFRGRQDRNKGSDGRARIEQAVSVANQYEAGEGSSGLQDYTGFDAADATPLSAGTSISSWIDGAPALVPSATDQRASVVNVAASGATATVCTPGGKYVYCAIVGGPSVQYGAALTQAAAVTNASVVNCNTDADKAEAYARGACS